MKVGVVGAGAMGSNHVRVYSDLKGVDEVLVYDMDTTRAKTIAGNFGATAVPSMDDMMSCDAVSICVPTEHHYRVASMFIHNSVNTLVEKPVCSTVTDSLKLTNLAAQRKCIVGCGHIERFNPIVPEIRKMITDPLYIEFKRHNPASARITRTPVVDDLMIHDIDVLFNGFNLFDSLFQVDARGTGDIASVLFSFDDVIASFSASRKSSRKIRTICIEEEERTIVGDYMTQEVYVYHKPGNHQIENDRYTQENVVEKVIVNKVEPLREELKHFIWCVKKNVPFLVSLNDASQNVMMCQTIKEKMGIP